MPYKNLEDRKKYNKLWRERNKDILKQKKKNYYYKNKTKISLKAKRHRKENKEKIKEYLDNWRKKNREYGKKYSKIYNKKYYQDNKEIISKKNKEWEKNNRKKRAKQRKRYRKEKPEIFRVRNALRNMKLRKKNILTDLGRENIFEIIKRDKVCVYCKSNKKLSIEHIIPITKNGKNLYTNLVRACISCNTSKGNRDVFEWCKWKGYSVPEIVIKCLKGERVYASG